MPHSQNRSNPVNMICPAIIEIRVARRNWCSRGDLPHPAGVIKENLAPFPDPTHTTWPRLFIFGE